MCTLTFVGLGASRSNLMPFWTNIIYDEECTYNEMQLRCIFMKCPLCTDLVDRKLNCFSFSVWIWIWVVDPSAKRSSCFSFSFPFFSSSIHSFDWILHDWIGDSKRQRMMFSNRLVHKPDATIDSSFATQRLNRLL